MQETGLIYAEALEQLQGEMQRQQAKQVIYETIENSMDHPMDFLDRNHWEREVLGLIALGNPALLQAYIHRDLGPEEAIQTPELAREALNREKYVSIIFIALACRAAMEGGLPEHIAFGMSDGCIWAIDHAQSAAEVTSNRHDAAMSFCNAVQNHKMEHLSPPVRRCCSYMALRMHATISLEELSRVCHLSPHYISDLFRKELGISAVQFFQKNKLLYAKHLLKNTSQAVSEIAAQLSYPSHSNFTERFKREYGITPQQFRHLEEIHSHL